MNNIDPTGMAMPGDDKLNLTAEQTAVIAVLSNQWFAAQAAGDKAGMAAAHDAANAIRNGLGSQSSTTSNSTRRNSSSSSKQGQQSSYSFESNFSPTAWDILVAAIAVTRPALSLEQVYKTANQWRDNAAKDLNPRRNPLPSGLYKTNAPPVVVVSGPTNIVVYAHLSISGNADKKVSGTVYPGLPYKGTSYREAVLEGIKYQWSTEKYNGKKVTVRAIDVGTNKSIMPLGQKSISVEIREGADESTGGPGSPMILYTKAPTGKELSLQQFRGLAAHEFGHSGFHIYDVYGSPLHPNADPGITNPFPSIMNNPYTTKAQQVDYDMVFENKSWESKNWVYYSSSPNILDTHVGAGNW